MRKSGKQAARIRQHGIRATAQVESIAHTGVRINDVPQMKIVLGVRIEGQSPYETSTKMLLHPSTAAQSAPGTSLPVRVDPQNRKKSS